MTVSRRDFLAMLGGTFLHHAARPIKPPKKPRVRHALATVRCGAARAFGVKTNAVGNVVPLPPGTQVWPVVMLTTIKES